MMAVPRPGSEEYRHRNLRTALALAGLALAFFAAIVVKYRLFP